MAAARLQLVLSDNEGENTVAVGRVSFCRSSDARMISEKLLSTDFDQISGSIDF